MNEAMERDLLVTEVSAYISQLRRVGVSVKDTSPKQDGTLDHLSLPDLRQTKDELRDLVRSLGGAKS